MKHYTLPTTHQKEQEKHIKVFRVRNGEPVQNFL